MGLLCFFVRRKEWHPEEAGFFFASTPTWRTRERPKIMNYYCIKIQSLLIPDPFLEKKQVFFFFFSIFAQFMYTSTRMYK